MKIHLRQVPQGGTLHIEQDLDPGFLGLDDTGAKAISPLHVSLDVGVSGSGLFATGKLGIRLGMVCVSCLKPIEYDLSVDSFATQIELDGREDVDLTDDLREHILLDLPLYPRCDAGGTGRCPSKFPIAPSVMEPEKTPDPSRAWDALDKLNPNQ